MSAVVVTVEGAVAASSGDIRAEDERAPGVPAHGRKGAGAGLVPAATGSVTPA
ncbi:MAG TPA: hypothetical protein VIV06_02825 [Candidatus Limnocylindrales bacterium]